MADILPVADRCRNVGGPLYPVTVQSPPTIAPDQKDWTWVLDRPCPDCEFDARRYPPRQTGPAVRATVPRWQRVLAEPEASRRRAAAVWSPVEYGCHVRDVCTVFADRLAQMLAADGARFANWDQDATAVEKRYWTADPTRVAAEYATAASALADGFDAVPDTGWQHRGIRSNGSQFTVETFAGYLLHDLVHHLYDVRG